MKPAELQTFATRPSRTSGAYSAWSLSMRLRSCAGVDGMSSKPSVSMRARISGESIAATRSRCSRSSTGLGVAAGATTPAQGRISTSGAPASASVGSCEWSFSLVTRSKFDVRWNDLNKRYAFGFAAFDNAQVRHATADDPMFLVFGK